MKDRTILHSDCNCFYASVEMLYHPELRNVPMCVGGDPVSRHGIVLTANYLAKRCGVKVGMAVWQARQVCPELAFVSPRMDVYSRFSRMAREIYSDYTDRQEPFGIDESWLDVTETCSLKGDGVMIANELRARMKKELGITVSVGVSWNKVFAKLGSDYKKPDATTRFMREDYNIIRRIPVEDLLYVGRSTARKLKTLGITTIGKLADTPESVLSPVLGCNGYLLKCWAMGMDDAPVNGQNFKVPVKSIGNSTTTSRDMICNEDVRLVYFVLAESVGRRMREQGFQCREIEISVRNNELEWFTRQMPISKPTNITAEIAGYAYELFLRSYDWEKPLRSIGVRGTKLCWAEEPVQYDLFINEEQREKQRKTDAAVDDIRQRFGYYSLQRGVMYTDSELSHVNAREEHTIHPRAYY